MRRVPVFKTDDRLHSRIKQLWQDGYVAITDSGDWELTVKGWLCLAACADRPLTVPQKKEAA